MAIKDITPKDERDLLPERYREAEKAEAPATKPEPKAAPQVPNKMIQPTSNKGK